MTAMLTLPEHSVTTLDTVHHLDALTLLRALPSGSVQLIATDPPYFKVKDDDWDHQWDTADHYLAWLDRLCQEWRRVLAPNGSLYVFASPQMAAHVEVTIGRWFNVLNSLIWWKTTGNRNWSSDKDQARAWFPNTERMVFAEQYGADSMAKGEAGYGAACDELRGFVFEPLRIYLANERDRAGWTTRRVAEQYQKKTGSRTVTGMAGHWFERVQWALPTEENYEWLRCLFNNGPGEYLRRDYEDLRRPFDISAEKPFTDVWFFKPVQAYPDKHPAEKPLDLMTHIITASSRPGDTVLDPFCGSGTTLDAARRAERHFIGCDMDRHWVDYARHRVTLPYNQPLPMFDAPDATPTATQVAMFAEHD